jgi:AraC-like DNA-binding protein
MTNYQIVRPSIELQPFVEEYWIQENSDISCCIRPTTVLPTNTSDLILVYGDPFVQINQGETKLLPLSYLCGQKTKPVQVAPTGKTGLIIVRFKPWGAAPFFDFSMDELTDSSVDLHLLASGLSVRKLENQIHELTSSAERIHEIEVFLLNQLKMKLYDSLMVEAVHRINQMMGILSIADLVEDLNLSRRQFHRRFTRAIGMGPKEFAKITRFQKTLYQTKCGADWQELITTCGFYDQPHLIREMKKYSGFSYRNIFAANPANSLMQHFNTHRGMTHLYNTVYL